MTTTIDFDALQVSEGPRVTLLGNQEVGGGLVGDDFADFSAFASLSVDVKVQRLSSTSPPPLLTLLVEHSDDGLSWSTSETFTFTDDGEQTASLASPKAHVRARASGSGAEWYVKSVNVAPITGGGGGGSMPAFSGALVRLSATTSGLANADTIPFDVVEADSDDYFNAGNHSFVIPIGKAGLYLIGAMLIVGEESGFTPDSGLIGILSGDDTDVRLCPSFDVGAAFATGSMILSYAEGGVIVPKISFNTDGPAQLNGGMNGSWFFCQWLGPLPT